MKINTLPVALLGSALLLQGCIYAPDAGNRPLRGSTAEPTLGQELLDLQRAREAGAISDEEFRGLRDRLIDARD